jgi:hypothetical protein
MQIIQNMTNFAITMNARDWPALCQDLLLNWHSNSECSSSYKVVLLTNLATNSVTDKQNLAMLELTLLQA